MGSTYFSMASKIDYYGQIILLASVIMMALPYPLWPIGIFYSLICIVPLGVWQLISSAVIWFNYKHVPEETKPLHKYWIAAIICISVCIISVVAVTPGNTQWYGIYKYLFIASLIASLLVSAYFVFIYKKYYLHNEAKEDSGVGRIS